MYELRYHTAAFKVERVLHFVHNELSSDLNVKCFQISVQNLRRIILVTASVHNLSRPPIHPSSVGNIFLNLLTIVNGSGRFYLRNAHHYSAVTQSTLFSVESLLTIHSIMLSVAFHKIKINTNNYLYKFGEAEKTPTLSLLIFDTIIMCNLIKA